MVLGSATTLNFDSCTLVQIEEGEGLDPYVRFNLPRIASLLGSHNTHTHISVC